MNYDEWRELKIQTLQDAYRERTPWIPSEFILDHIRYIVNRLDTETIDVFQRVSTNTTIDPLDGVHQDLGWAIEVDSQKALTQFFILYPAPLVENRVLQRHYGNTSPSSSKASVRNPRKEARPDEKQEGVWMPPLEVVPQSMDETKETPLVKRKVVSRQRTRNPKRENVSVKQKVAMDETKENTPWSLSLPQPVSMDLTQPNQEIVMEELKEEVAPSSQPIEETNEEVVSSPLPQSREIPKEDTPMPPLDTPSSFQPISMDLTQPNQEIVIEEIKEVPQSKEIPKDDPIKTETKPKKEEDTLTPPLDDPIKTETKPKKEDKLDAKHNKDESSSSSSMSLPSNLMELTPGGTLFPTEQARVALTRQGSQSGARIERKIMESIGRPRSERDPFMNFFHNRRAEYQLAIDTLLRGDGDVVRFFVGVMNDYFSAIHQRPSPEWIAYAMRRLGTTSSFITESFKQYLVDQRSRNHWEGIDEFVKSFISGYPVKQDPVRNAPVVQSGRVGMDPDDDPSGSDSESDSENKQDDASDEKSDSENENPPHVPIADPRRRAASPVQPFAHPPIVNYPAVVPVPQHRPMVREVQRSRANDVPMEDHHDIASLLSEEHGDPFGNVVAAITLASAPNGNDFNMEPRRSLLTYVGQMLMNQDALKDDQDFLDCIRQCLEGHWRRHPREEPLNSDWNTAWKNAIVWLEKAKKSRGKPDMLYDLHTRKGEEYAYVRALHAQMQGLLRQVDTLMKSATDAEAALKVFQAIKELPEVEEAPQWRNAFETMRAAVTDTHVLLADLPLDERKGVPSRKDMVREMSAQETSLKAENLMVKQELKDLKENAALYADAFELMTQELDTARKLTEMLADEKERLKVWKESQDKIRAWEEERKQKATSRTKGRAVPVSLTPLTNVELKVAQKEVEQLEKELEACHALNAEWIQWANLVNSTWSFWYTDLGKMQSYWLQYAVEKHVQDQTKVSVWIGEELEKWRLTILGKNDSLSISSIHPAALPMSDVLDEKHENRSIHNTPAALFHPGATPLPDSSIPLVQSPERPERLLQWQKELEDQIEHEKKQIAEWADLSQDSQGIAAAFQNTNVLQVARTGTVALHPRLVRILEGNARLQQKTVSDLFPGLAYQTKTSAGLVQKFILQMQKDVDQLLQDNLRIQEDLDRDLMRVMGCALIGITEVWDEQQRDLQTLMNKWSVVAEETIPEFTRFTELIAQDFVDTLVTPQKLWTRIGDCIRMHVPVGDDFDKLLKTLTQRDRSELATAKAALAAAERNVKRLTATASNPVLQGTELADRALDSIHGSHWSVFRQFVELVAGKAPCLRKVLMKEEYLLGSQETAWQITKERIEKEPFLLKFKVEAQTMLRKINQATPEQFDDLVRQVLTPAGLQCIQDSFTYLSYLPLYKEARLYDFMTQSSLRSLFAELCAAEWGTRQALILTRTYHRDQSSHWLQMHQINKHMGAAKFDLQNAIIYEGHHQWKSKPLFPKAYYV